MTRRALALFPAALAVLALSNPAAAGAGPVGLAFVPITGCRAVDTRGPSAPALGPSEVRTIVMTGTCGIPANALGLAVNLTVVNPAAIGFAVLYAGDAAIPPTSDVAFIPGRTRAGFAITALASDGSGTVALANGSSGSADYLIDVLGYFIRACTATITVTNPVTASGTVNAAFSQSFTSSGGTGTVTYTTASPLPAGLTLAPNGTLSGTPTQSGTFPIAVTATDANGCAGTGATYTLVISCQTITVTNPGVTTGTANVPFSQTFTQSGGVGTTTFSTPNALPIGMTLAANGVLSGTPTQAGAFDIVVTATDANGCTGAGATYHLVINCQTITVTNPAITGGTAGAAFSQTFTQSGAIGTATFTTASTLPAGLTLAASGILSGTPTQTGLFPIVVTVTDANLCTGTGATYNLTIGCQTILVTNPSTTSGTAGTPFSQTFTQAGAIGSATFTTASTLPSGLTLSPAGVLSGTPTQTGSFPIVVTVTDANGCTGAGATYTLVVACPTMTVSPSTLPQATNGVLYPSVTFTETGGLGSVTFSQTGTLPNGMSFSIDTLAGTPTETGSFPITVTASDANGCTGSRDYLLVVVCSGTSITLLPASLPVVTAGSPFPSTTFTASGGTGPYAFAEAGALPTGLTFTPGTATLDGTPTQTGTFPITVSATDTVGGCVGSQDYVVTVTCSGVTITVAPPTLSPATAGTPYGPVTFTASGGTPPYTLAETGALPTGMTYSTATSQLSGTPSQGGTFPIVLTATDAAGCVGATSYGFVVVCPTITVTNPATATGTVDAAFSQTFTETGAAGTATFTTTSTLPAGLTLSPAGVLSGTPTVNGTFPIVVKVTDANGCTGTGATYTLVVSCQTITVTSPGTTTGTVDAAFSQTFTQTGVGTHTPATFTTSSTLPAGLTLSAAGVLSGTPTAPGTFDITVTVTDANGCTGTTAAPYHLVIACQAITVNSPPSTAATYSTALAPAGNYTFTQSGVGSHTPVTYTLASGSLPTGVSLSAGGVLTGTPTQTGAFTITVKATDANGCFGTSASYTLSVGPKLTAKSYADVGNTQLAGGIPPPATPSVSVVAVSNGDTSDTTITYAVITPPAHGTLTFNTTGSFLYTPNAGNTTADSFTYTGTSNGVSATQTAGITFTGMVWYVDSASGASGDGRSNTPFSTMTAVGAAATSNGDFIYVAHGSGSTTGAYTMKTSQQLIGAGATLNVPTVSPILTVAGNTANTPTLSGTLTLASSVVVNGIDLNTAASRAITNFNGSSYATVTGVSITARTVTTTTGTAIDIQGSGNTGTMSFTSVSANGGTNGIVLSNFTGGSFTVAGAGGACFPSDTTCSGGTIQNMTGGDDSSAVPVGTGVVLNNVASVSLTGMRIRSNSNYDLRGTSVAGFTMSTCLLDGSTGTNGATPFNDGAVSFDNLTGSASVSNTNIQGGLYNNFQVVNTSGTLNRLTFTNVTFDVGANTTFPTNDALTIESQNAAVVNVTVQNSFIKSAAGDLFQLNNIGTGADDLVFTGNTLTNANSAIATGGGGVTIGSNGTGDISYNLDTNTFRDAVGHAILIVKSTGPSSVAGTFNNNAIGVAATANSGSNEGDGLKVQNAGQGTVKATITNNQIFQYNNFGIEFETGGGATAQPGALNVVVTGNTIANHGSNPAFTGIPWNGIQLNAGTVPGDTYQICAQVGGAGALANAMTGSGAGGGTDYRLRQRQSTTVKLPGYGGANNDNTAVVTFVSGNNGGASGTASNTVASGGGGFVGGAPCP